MLALMCRRLSKPHVCGTLGSLKRMACGTPAMIASLGKMDETQA